MIATDNLLTADSFSDSTVTKWKGNTAKLTLENHSPAVPLTPTSPTDYKCLAGWRCLGYCFAPWPSKTHCPTCLVFEHEDGRLLWAHCTHEICIEQNV